MFKDELNVFSPAWLLQTICENLICNLELIFLREQELTLCSTLTARFIVGVREWVMCDWMRTLNVYFNSHLIVRTTWLFCLLSLFRAVKSVRFVWWSLQQKKGHFLNSFQTEKLSECHLGSLLCKLLLHPFHLSTVCKTIEMPVSQLYP